MDETAILADPAETSLARKRTLEQRRGIDADLVVERLMFAQEPGEARQAVAERVMVVGAPGVTRDPAEIGVMKFGGIRLRRIVELSDANHRSRRRQQIARIVADGGPMV